jgi:nitrate reductase NapE component
MIVISEMEQLKALQTLSFECNTTQRCLLNMLLADSGIDRKKIKDKILESSWQIDRQFEKLDDLKKNKPGQELLTNLTASCFTYRKNCGLFLTFVDSNKTVEAINFDKTEMYPSFLAFQNMQQQTADYINAITTQHNERTSSRTRSFGFITITIAALPLLAWIIIGTFLLLYMFFVVRPRGKKSARTYHKNNT